MAQNVRHLAVAVVLLIGLAGDPLSGRAQPREEGKQPFDYADYAEVLKIYVSDKGMVDYKQLKAHPEKLLAYVAAIARMPRSHYRRWDDHTKIAFWLNAYNGLTLKAIIDNYPIKSSFLKSRIYPKNSIRQISGVWDKIKFRVMGQRVTLSHIEHEILRAQFNEPRIHMVLVCAAMGCPSLRNEPYVGDRLEEQLDDQSRDFLGHRLKFRIDRGKDTVHLSPIFKWFGGDFVNAHAPARRIGRYDGEVAAMLNFVAGYLEGTDKRYILTGDFKVKYLDYDWSLNEQRRLRAAR
jgi:Protein of unknown function, DUF547